LRRKGWPARGFDGGRRRWPRRLREHGEDGIVLGNKRAWEVHGCLVKLPEQLAGDERQREHELRAAAAMAGEEHGVARVGKEEGFK
jgi:hypothetical protein